MVTELQIGDVSVDVVFKDIKNVHLSVYPPTGRVRISAPERMNIDAIRVFAISKLGWIRKQQSKLKAQDREPPREYLERESHYLWGRRYLLRLLEGGDAARATADHRHIILNLPAGASAARKQAALDQLYRAEIKTAAKPLIAKWEKHLGRHVERFFVQRMKTKWGSSNPRLGTIRLNLELAKKPVQCLDYVILHEVMHFLIPNHSERFVVLMEDHMPNWQQIRQRLNEAPLAHSDWSY